MPLDYSKLPVDPWTCNDENVRLKGSVNQGTADNCIPANPLASYDGFQGDGLAISDSDEGLKRGWAKEGQPEQHN